MPLRTGRSAGARRVLIPLTTDRPRRRSPVLIHALVLFNSLVFVWTLSIQAGSASAYYDLLTTYAVQRENFQWFQLLTSAFLHSGWMHLIFNMLVLMALGPNVEDKMGHVGFALLYIIGSAASGGAHVYMTENAAIGASGAIAAVTGAYLVLFPNTRIICFFIFTLSRIAVPAWWFIGFSIAVDLLANGFGKDEGIAHAAHLGGYFFGIGSTMVLLWLHILKREPYDLFTVLRQRKRRADFASAAKSHDHMVQQRVGAARPESPRTKALYEARARIGELVSGGDLDKAADEYRVFVDEFGTDEPSSVLSRDLQLRLAEHLMRSGDRASAARAYIGFARSNQFDREAPGAMLIAALILAEDLGKPEEARPLIEEALPKLAGQEKELAQTLLASLGVPTDS